MKIVKKEVLTLILPVIGAVLLVGAATAATLNTKSPQPPKTNVSSVAGASDVSPPPPVTPPPVDNTVKPPPQSPQKVPAKTATPSCVTTTLTASTEHRSDPTRYIGESYTSKGSDGYITYCPDRPTVTVYPIKHIVFNGSRPQEQQRVTAPTTTSNESDSQARQQRIQACISRVQALSPGSSAYMQCYSTQ